MSIELLINLSSRRARLAYADVLAACEKHGLTLDKIHRVERETSIRSLVKTIAKQPPKLLLVGGGDGTISDVVDHLVGTPIEIGVIPLGTTNNFARSLEMPETIDACIERIKRSRAEPVDLGRIGDDYFTNVASMGISGKIASSVKNEHKRRFGRLAYAVVGLRVLLTHKPFFVKIQDTAANLEISLETHQLVVANGKFHAGRKIASDAQLDNRELVIFALGSRSKLSFVYHMLDYYTGRRRSIRHASYFVGRSVRIIPDTPKKVEIDGEVKCLTPIDVTVAPAAIKVRF